jgi:hypothetical protein
MRFLGSWQKLNEFGFKLNYWMIFDQKIPKMQRGCSEKIILDRKISLS